MAKNLDLYNYIKDNKTYLLCLFLFSILFVVVYSTSTSFIYKYPEINDYSASQLIGKYWLEGSIPYRDLFDNKGPLFYAINALGYWLLGNKTGLLLVQIIFLYATAIITFHFFNIGFSKRASLWLSTAILLGLSLGYSGGNHGSEYSLPFIMLSFYLFYCWLNKSAHTQTKHPSYYNYIYGLTIGVCFMTRPSNGLVVFMIVLYLIIYYIANKQIKALLKSLILVAFGCLSISLPFILYYIANDCLNDFYNALIVCNISYLKNSGIMSSPMYLKRAIALLFSYINCLMFVIISILQIVTGHRKINGIFWLATSIICIIFFLRTNCYPNYAHICLPFAVIGLIELKNMYKEKGDCRYLKPIISSAAFCLISINTFNGVYSVIKYTTKDYSNEKVLYFTYDEFMQEIPKDEYDSFVAYECPSEIYLRWGIRPCYRFFAMQAFSDIFNRDIFDETINEFNSGKAQWILVNYRIGIDSEIEEALKSKYQPIKGHHHHDDDDDDEIGHNHEHEFSSPDAILVLYKKKQQ